MVNEISNRTLAILLIAAIVISLGGTLVSLNRISRVSIGLPGITGFATNATNATARVEVSDVTWVNFTQIAIDFGTGFVSGGTSCTMNSSGDDSPPVDTNCMSFMGSNQSLGIRNIGNNDVIINLSFAKTSATLLGGSAAKGRNYSFLLWNDTANPGCINKTAINDSYWAPTAAYNWSVPSTANEHVTVCRNLSYINGNNQMNISIKLIIPDDSLTGVLEDNISVTAESH